MLRCVKRPLISYDLLALASGEGMGYVSVGREQGTLIQLDSPDIPALLSRKHATLLLVPGAPGAPSKFTLVDGGSTNGTFAARPGQPLRRLPPGYAWELQHGDTVGFGGPETIIVQKAQVGNPFLFKFYTESYTEEAPEPSLCPVRSLTAQQQMNSPGQDHDTLYPSPAAMHCADSEGVRSQVDEPQQQPHPPSRATCDVIHSHPLQSIGNRQPAHAQQLCSPRTGKASKDASVKASLCSNTPKSKKMAEVLSQHLSCAMCYDWLLASHTLSCGHMFCGLCLATWLSQKQTCPSCRMGITGVPVRCFQVDATITDLLSCQPMSPDARKDRKRKQEHWDHIQSSIVQEWATALQRRRDVAVQSAVRHNQQLQASVSVPGQPAPQQPQQQQVAAPLQPGAPRASRGVYRHLQFGGDAPVAVQPTGHASRE